MRTKTVTLNGKQVVVKEQKVKTLREDVAPKLFGILEGAEDIEMKDIVPHLEQRIAEFFPELSEADLDEAYPSEIEALIEAYIDVNFGGLKKVMKPLLSFLQKGTSTPR
ncbi:hypothetical protein [Paenibacillus abyssi]|uniref:Phage protein n=1 Tax=Paenibacillus abyssi TaxID=1340531 RepID=A0A917CJD8_9BACL|nr:hypothetical protein [Paenibacillus abyssi]GGF88495.1 hypothetical protein GCM10010916_02320 [Paenibacillus abyssi]